VPSTAPAGVHDRAGAPGGRGAALDERGVIARGHEADLLAVGLVGDLQAEAARVLAHGGLVERPTGKAARAS
jgi:adenine deaminase